MNWYERHLGDYARDTGHLSLLEHGAYTLILDRYYATEEGIPEAQAYRVARARTAPDRDAVDAVLTEFFTLADGMWRHGRVDAVIAEFQEGGADREAKRENAKERQRRSRARRAELFAALREGGHVPPWDTTTSELERLLSRHLSRMPSQPVTPPVTRDDTATQPPPTNHHTQEKQKKEPASPNGSRLPLDWVLPAEWRDWALAERADVDPEMQAQSFADYWHGVAGAKGRKADWAGTWRNWIRRADAPRARAGPRGDLGKHSGFDQRDYGKGGLM